MLSYAADTTFWAMLLCVIFFSITNFIALLKFGLISLAFITLFLTVWFILIKKYYQKYGLNQQYKMEAKSAPIHLTNQYQQQTILITGAAGTIGSELAQQLAVISNGTILLLDQSETGLHDLMNTLSRSNANVIPILVDIRSAEQMQQLFKQYKPNLVFHVAAYKQLPMLEKFPSEAVLTNIVGTKNLVDTAQQNQVQKFIYISTDKAVNPTSILGITKKIAENYVQLKLENCITTRFAVVRFGNVWNSNGSVLPLWEQQLCKCNAIEVRNPKASRYFISASSVANLLIEIGAFSNMDQKYLLSMGQPVVIKELAHQFIKSKQWTYINRVHIKYTSLLDGEKLHESLLADEEKLEESKHPKIKVIVPSVSEKIREASELDSLLNSFKTMDTNTLKKELHLFVN